MSDEDPFSAPIEITNENPIPILYVRAGCIYNFQSTNYRVHDISLSTEESERTILWPKGKLTARCDKGFHLSGQSIQEAEMSVSVCYHPLLFPFKFERITVFNAVTRDKVIRWIPVNSN